MSIQFTEERWEKIKEMYDAWWAGTLERPILPVVIKGRKPEREEPKAPLLSQQTSLDLSIPVADLIDRIDYELSQNIYLGDAYPYYNMDCFGPGVLSAFLGAIPDNSTGQIWFAPKEIKELSELHFEYDSENVWFNRVKEIYREANKRWNGQVVMGMVDLGGILDVLAVFRGTDNLLFDLYDGPEEVHRLVKELHELWIRYYNELCDILAPVAKGYSDWSKIFSSERSYVIQCDFSFMISNEMFKEFALEELVWLTNEIPNTIYHLDGPGELNHLKDIVEISNLNAVQWVPGAGAPIQQEWPDVYQTIHKEHKGIQIWEGTDCLKTISEQIGTTKGILHWDIYETMDNYDKMLEVLKSYSIE